MEQEIMKISKTVSSLVAEKILNHGIAKVGKSTICSLLKKTIKIDKAHVKRVCIDDFSLKKRHTYGTIMIDIDTHQVVDLIHSRDREEVIRWLKTFPN
ncbi:ISL3 family transposase, partial [Bacillus wiedmannii]